MVSHYGLSMVPRMGEQKSHYVRSKSDNGRSFLLCPRTCQKWSRNHRVYIYIMYICIVFILCMRLKQNQSTCDMYIHIQYILIHTHMYTQCNSIIQYMRIHMYMCMYIYMYIYMHTNCNTHTHNKCMYRRRGSRLSLVRR